MGNLFKQIKLALTSLTIWIGKRCLPQIQLGDYTPQTVYNTEKGFVGK